MPERAKQDTDAKVVHLEPESQRIVRAKLARLPAAVNAVHEKGRFLVLNLLKSFFDRADDSLFELADKAQSNQEQNLYFDSMREVRVQRRGIEKRFGDSIDIAFSDLISSEQASPAENHQNFSPDTLSLVEKDELEEIVAVDTSVARANQKYGEAVQLISLRLDSLLPVKVYQKNNPLGPDLLCSTFMDEVKKLDVGIRAKLVLFKLYDKAVVSRLNDVYGPVNELFCDHNVLPSLAANAGVGARGRRRGDAAGNAIDAVNTASLDASLGAESDSVLSASNVSPEVLSTLKNMLGDRVLSNPSASSQTQVAANELIKLLSDMQHMPAVTDNRVAINVKALLAQLQQQSGVTSRIGQVDDQVMNLVNMLFDFILEDRNLAAPMKALISRMQIPIIKVAVADKSFFTKSSHVARKLLNEMATAAMGWTGDENSSQKDPLYKKIESIVRQLIENFETDLGVFSELLADFSAFLEKEKKRAAVLERRTIDAEDGKAKAEVARTTVELEMEVRTVGLQLPKVVSDLIKDAWSNVLFVTALKYGYEAEEWETQLSVLEELVWSVQPPRTLEQRQKLIKIVPGLLRKLRNGLDTISYNPFEMSDLFKSLEKVHIACIRGQSRARKAQQKASQDAAAKQAAVQSSPQKSEASNTSVGRVSADKATNPQVTVSAKRPVPKKPDSRSAPLENSNDFPARSLSDLAKGVELSEIDEVDKLLSLSEAEEATFGSGLDRGTEEKDGSSSRDSSNSLGRSSSPAHGGQGSRSTSPEPSKSIELKVLPSDDPYMKQASLFSQGTWFDMENAKGENIRCRLAALIKPTGKYIFVNRNGMKVAEHSQQDLAYMLKSSTLRSLDDSILFDRALETVVTGLRKL